MIWVREQYLDLMTRGRFERPMFVELFGPLIGLEDEWRQQGASEDEINLTAFDFDSVDRVGAGGNCGVMGGVEHVVLEETPTYRIERDRFGRRVELDKRTATIALPTEFPVKSMDDWLRFKPMYAWHDDRIDRAAIEQARRRRDAGALVTIGIPGAYDTARNLMGEELACMAYYEQPELMRDILDTCRDTSLRVIDQVTQHVTVDQLSVHEDMAGKSGPLVGPAQVREFFKPYFSAVWDLVRSRGACLFGMDTDGNVNAILDDLLNTGLNAMHPFEPAAGMDVVALRRQYGERLAMRGGIDKFALLRGREPIDAELAYKLQPDMVAAGRIAFGLDHRIPNGVTIDDYRYYVTRAREMLGLPPRDVKRRGWARMAF